MSLALPLDNFPESLMPPLGYRDIGQFPGGSCLQVALWAFHTSSCQLRWSGVLPSRHPLLLLWLYFSLFCLHWLNWSIKPTFSTGLLPVLCALLVIPQMPPLYPTNSWSCKSTLPHSLSWFVCRGTMHWGPVPSWKLFSRGCWIQRRFVY